ncbi:MATE family efflux transporter [Microcoleus sp. FACHB-SPT15]|uniref:MATE family efflux transporter n=1 Tax=Microcoleus sp. FACHB-SPT15 TaxID=2692830 RepID=UPI001785A0C8|nr:MATE family efflux transporter [Microcoleus sp. FACHB-SPT15]MBD1808622.1 MATE family efflux transporter [Microcoleus sp. FACHB-SPT15]
MNFRAVRVTYALSKSRVIAEIKECLLLAVPLAGAQLSQAATTFVDTVMMGTLGSQIIAAGALGAATFFLLLNIGSAIVSAVSPLAAEAYGGGRVEPVGRVVRQGLWLSVILAVPVTLLIWHSGTLLGLMGQEPENIALAEGYLRAIAWGYFPGLGFAVLRSFVSALSRTRPVIVTMICGTLFNVAVNYVLAFGKFGLPALGLAGLGWASTLSLWGMFVALAIYILSQPQLRVYGAFANLHQFDGKIFWELVRVGVPIGVLAGVEGGFFAFATLLMGQLGTVTLAAHQIALQSAVVTFTISLGISMAATVRVGQLIGQENPKGARLAGFVSIGMAAVFMGIMGIVFWIVPGTIVSLYIDTADPANAAVVSLAKTLLGVAAMFQLVDGVQVTAAGALRGLKDTKIPLLIGILAYWAVGLSCGYTLGFVLGWGSVGLWWGFAIGLAVAAGVLTWRFGKMALHSGEIV